MERSYLLGSLLAVVSAGCVGGPGVDPVEPRPVSEFPVSFTSEGDTFYSEQLTLSLGWASEGGGYAGLAAEYAWGEPDVGVHAELRRTFAIGVLEEPELDNGRIHIGSDARVEGVSSVDLLLLPDGSIEGTIVGDHFVNWGEGDAPTPTEVTVRGRVEIDCSNAGPSPVLELNDGSIATFDCAAAFATFTITPPTDP